MGNSYPIGQHREVEGRERRGVGRIILRKSVLATACKGLKDMGYLTTFYLFTWFSFQNHILKICMWYVFSKTNEFCFVLFLS